MDVYTHFEDLSNEILFEIFDYLHAFEIFTSFTLLNRRISSILQSIPFHIVILKKHCRRQIDFLSSHLTFHDHQVISIKTFDTIRDDSSIISLLFNRHNFINLKSCSFFTINSLTRLENVIKQIKNLNQLISFSIYQPNNKNLNENYKYDLTRIILLNKLSSLRSVVLKYPYDYLDISNYTSIASNLISLKLWISGSPSTVSVYSILSILRLCHRIQYLSIIMEQKIDESENNDIIVSIEAPPMNDNDRPILSQVISFELSIIAMCDNHSIGYILRCMPNLKYFYFHLLVRSAEWPFPDELLNGYVWQQMLELHLPHLSKFEFHMSIIKSFPILNLDIIIKSFEYFVRKYSNWHMIIDRWTLDCQYEEEFVMLRTLNYHKHKSTINPDIPCIYCGSFDTRSTTAMIDDHYSFYSNMRNLKIVMTEKRPNITWSSPLFQQITYLLVEMPIINSSWWNNLFNIVNFRETNDNNRAQHIAIDLSNFVYLSNVIHLEFRSTFPVSRWKDIQFILQACSNVITLIINTPLLLLSKLIDNSFLIRIFKQIKMVKSITENIFFPSNFALKFVQRFPSLTDIELQRNGYDPQFVEYKHAIESIRCAYDEDSTITLLVDHLTDYPGILNIQIQHTNEYHSPIHNDEQGKLQLKRRVLLRRDQSGFGFNIVGKEDTFLILNYI
ncbi:unnamed protein product [Rotaria sordida]|uniref:F-box domain-containing protein n=1 Tax=Rotaria sordida TaxID=392033 RepID=A0A815MZU9_9BILA|nr:unnamed protein product [Rotaria sordida]